MDAAGFPHFPGNLDPRAQEFIPRNYITSFPLLPPPPLYCPYPPPPPPLPPPPTYHPHPFPPPPPPQAAYVSMTLPPPPMSVPSRALLVSMVPPDVSESMVRRDLEVFGDVRAVQMEKVRDGIVTVHFYDMRQARRALVAIQEQNMHQQYRLRRHYEEFVLVGRNYPPPAPPPGPGLIAGHVVWAQFTVPLASSMPHGNNQGTLVIFNLDPEVPSAHLKQLFEAFGHVRELRETPLKKHQRFVEFYDVRDAALALAGMNGKEIHGKQIVIEYSRPGGQCKKLSKSIRNNHSRNSLSISWNNNNNPSDNYSPRALRITPRSPPTPTSPPQPKPWRSPVANVPYRSNVSHSKPSNGYNRGNPKGNSARSSSSSSGNGIEELAIVSSSYSSNVKGLGNVKSNHASTSRPRQPQPKSGGSTKPWKDFRVSKEFDPRFLIDGDAIVDSNCRDSRTTVMIKNIPNKYSQKLILNMLDNHCIHCNEQIPDGDDQPLSSYDFVYLPIDFVNKCNVGYGFVNMTSPEATWRLYKAFHRQTWEVFNSRKICEVTYARLQGLEALKEHFKNSRFLCDSDEFMPVIFSPPRDGRLLTEPVPVFSRTSSSPPPLLECLSLSSKDASGDGETSGGSSQGQQEEEESAGRVNDSPDSDKTDGYEDFNRRRRGGSVDSNGSDSGEYYQGDGL